MIESNLEDEEEDHQQPAPEAEVAKVCWNDCYFQNIFNTDLALFPSLHSRYEMHLAEDPELIRRSNSALGSPFPYPNPVLLLLPDP
jgi:hypothetical protein